MTRKIYKIKIYLDREVGLIIEKILAELNTTKRCYEHIRSSALSNVIVRIIRVNF